MNLDKIKNQYPNIKIAHIVAFDNRHCIGKDNQLAWHIPEDLQHFKTITQNGVVLMGRKTFESIGRPLPNRTNWVITTDKSWRKDGIKIAQSLEDGLLGAMNDVASSGKDTLFIIGGGQIYKQTLAIMDIIYATKVDLDIGGDAFYPNIDHFALTDSSPIKQDSNSGVAFRFETYKRY